MVRRAGAVVAMLTAVLGLVSLAMAPAGADTISDEQQFAARINELRVSKGLAPLAVHAELTTIARSWAAEMARAGAISHNANFPNQVQADWAKLGENVGVGASVDSLMKAFINSPSHYANLVDAAFTHVGVGVVYGSDGRMYTSHQFMKLRAGTGGTAPAPTVTTAKPKPAPTVTAPKASTPRPTAAPKPAATTPAKPTTTSAAKPASTSAPVKVLTPRLKISLERLADLDAAA